MRQDEPSDTARRQVTVNGDAPKVGARRDLVSDRESVFCALVAPQPLIDSLPIRHFVGRLV